MSDIAKKTVPPGSWPGNKSRAGDNASEAAEDVRSAPRSAAAHESAKGDEHGEAQSGHYTHEPMSDIQEEQSTTGLKKAAPIPMSNGFTEHADDDHIDQELEKVQEEGPDAQGAKSELTESAKHALDLASEGKSTEGAREEFLDQANQDDVVPQDSVTSRDGPLDTQHVADEGEAPIDLQEHEVPKTEVEGEVPQTEVEGDVPKTEVEGEIPKTEVEGELEAEAPSQIDDLPKTQIEDPEGAIPALQIEGDVPTELQDEVDALELPMTAEFPLNLSALNDSIINKGGYAISPEGKLVGRVASGELADIVGRRVRDGKIYNDKGEEVGTVEPISDKEREDMLKESKPFENFENPIVGADGMVYDGEQLIGKVIEGDLKQLRNMRVDPDGDILNKQGDTVGRCERWDPEPEEEPEEEEPEVIDLSALDGGIVTKRGFVVDANGNAIGRVVEGDIESLVGKRVSDQGQIWSDSGKVLGRAELLPDNEREDLSKESGPFGAFPDAIVAADGWVTNGEGGDTIGRLTDGDAKALRNNHVEGDGEILSKTGVVVGHAERWEPEEEPEPEAIDYSILAGKRINKGGYAVDGSGQIFGRVVEGNIQSMIGRMCDKSGNVLSESGDILGRCELVSEGEREGAKEGPFAELDGLTVAKDGTVITPSGDIVGRLISGDAKTLVGRKVDQDGEVVDSNGNVLGKAERWEPEAEEKAVNPLAGLKVSKTGEVRNSDGDVVAKLTSGNLTECVGGVIDDDNDVTNHKGVVTGHVTPIGDIEEEGETEDEKKQREQLEEDKKLAVRLAVCIEQTLDQVRPICKMITEKIDSAESRRGKGEDVDEDALVKDVKPLIEEGGRILSEAKGIVRGLDPDGRIQANAKHKTASREATPEEYRLADLLKELAGDVTKTIDGAKKKLEDFPKAKKQLSPLWALLAEPLGQIIAAVGLLLSGVLGLVSRLLSGLGLGGILEGLLGTLGLNQVLEGLGVPGISGGKKKGGGGLLGGLLGGGK